MIVMGLKLSTLAILLGLGLGLPQVYGFLNPAGFASSVRKFPRSVPWGYALMLLGTAWFVYNLSQESISDFAAYKNLLFAGFAAVGITPTHQAEPGLHSAIIQAAKPAAT